MYYYIINPVAGEGRINKIQEPLSAYLKELGIAGEFIKTTGPGEAAKLTQIAISKGYNTIVAVGGDETINEIINALGDTRAALGVIPIGKKNELAKILGIVEWREACRALAARRLETVDLAKIKNRLFVLSANIGFETILTEKTAPKIPLPFRIKTYLGLFKEAAKFKPFHLKLKLNDELSVETECFNLVLSNSRSYTILNQLPNPKDEKIDVFLIGKLTKKEMMSFVYKYLKGQIFVGQRFSVLHAKKIDIDANPPQEIIVDGQPFGKTPSRIEIVPQKLRLIVGRKRAF